MLHECVEPYGQSLISWKAWKTQSERCQKTYKINYCYDLSGSGIGHFTRYNEKKSKNKKLRKQSPSENGIMLKCPIFLHGTVPNKGFHTQHLWIYDNYNGNRKIESTAESTLHNQDNFTECEQNQDRTCLWKGHSTTQWIVFSTDISRRHSNEEWIVTGVVCVAGFKKCNENSQCYLTNSLL